MYDLTRDEPTTTTTANIEATIDFSLPRDCTLVFSCFISALQLLFLNPRFLCFIPTIIGSTTLLQSTRMTTPSYPSPNDPNFARHRRRPHYIFASLSHERTFPDPIFLPAPCPERYSHTLLRSDISGVELWTRWFLQRHATSKGETRGFGTKGQGSFCFWDSDDLNGSLLGVLQKPC